MFTRLLARWKSHQALRKVKALDRLIQKLIPIHRYDLMKPLRKMGFVVVSDAELESGTTMYVLPERLTIRMNSYSDPYERRVALAMFLVHMSVSHPDTPNRERAPYFVYKCDLHSPDGPSHNEQWREFLEAQDLILPIQSFIELQAQDPERSTYLIQRVMQVTYDTVRKRAIHFNSPIAPTLTKPFSLGFPAPSPSDAKSIP
jgi:hypothetical protein